LPFAWKTPSFSSRSILRKLPLRTRRRNVDPFRPVPKKIEKNIRIPNKLVQKSSSLAMNYHPVRQYLGITDTSQPGVPGEMENFFEKALDRL
jgi:hypothetical protein